MVNLIVNEIVQNLKLDLSFVDKITGIVKVERASLGGVVKTFPIAVNTDITTCSDTEMLDFTPDDKKISVIYFEDRGTTLNRMENQSLYYTASFTLVCWINFKRIVGNLTNTSLIVGNLIKHLPVVMGNVSPLIGVVISITGEQANDGSVFSKYSYIEEQTQYLTYPYGYVALDMTADFSVRKECFVDLETQEVIC